MSALPPRRGTASSAPPTILHGARPPEVSATARGGSRARCALSGLLQTVGFTVDLDDFASMNEAVDERDHAGGVWEQLAPRGEGAICGDEDGSPALVAPVDDLRQHVGVSVAVSDVAQLVDLC